MVALAWGVPVIRALVFTVLGAVAIAVLPVAGSAVLIRLLRLRLLWRVRGRLRARRDAAALSRAGVL
ncbi:hypothetical protein BKA03_001538 [Demequina lutea]|uniref:Uncharacterized protein n=1 Tax=Demequina lutea TaxID=431489 RepID=A0A7Y9Z9U3_9MICO|nr:hypothetical protein [Demequina lutea]